MQSQTANLGKLKQLSTQFRPPGREGLCRAALGIRNEVAVARMVGSVAYKDDLKAKALFAGLTYLNAAVIPLVAFAP